jgi:hypothetical protein
MKPIFLHYENTASLSSSIDLFVEICIIVQTRQLSCELYDEIHTRSRHSYYCPGHYYAHGRLTVKDGNSLRTQETSRTKPPETNRVVFL